MNPLPILYAKSILYVLQVEDRYKIAKAVRKRKNILIPSAYYESIGRKHTQKVPCDSCKWDQKTVVNILETGNTPVVR